VHYRSEENIRMWGGESNSKCKEERCALDDLRGGGKKTSYLKTMQVSGKTQRGESHESQWDEGEEVISPMCTKKGGGGGTIIKTLIAYV